MSKRKSISGELPFEDSSFSKSGYKRCFESHPPLIIGDQKIWGGSCSSPVVKDADIYVGLDMSIAKSPKSYPWEEGESFLFYIQDMAAPADPKQFSKLIDYLAVQLTASKKIHVGCIGGHGRTGTVLSALVAVMAGEKDAITYVRDHYCVKAVESASQVDFLVKHFGVKAVPGAKSHGATSGRWSGSSNVKELKPVAPPRDNFPSGAKSFTPMLNPMSLWGANVTFDNQTESGIIKV